MNYLLDTHYILWTLFEPKLIKEEIKRILLNEDDSKYISGISLWEISLKYSLGKLEFENTNPDEIFEKIIESGFGIINVENEIFSSYYKLPKIEDHKDPFDRMLIWQAISNDFIFITNDKKIEKYIEFGLKMKLGT